MSLFTLTVSILIVAILAREYWLFRQLPRAAEAARACGDRRTARAILESLLSKPSIYGQRSRADIHYRLAWSDLEEGRPAEAAEHARRSVAVRLHPAIESLHRLRLADCLEACGDADGAAAERARAKRLAESGPVSAVKLLAHGKALRKEGRYLESIPVYERAIELSKSMAPGVRTHLMVTLALSCWEAGRVPQALQWADCALALGPDLTHRASAYSVSALALANLGRLDDAAERWNLAYAAALEAGNTGQAAKHLASLASVQQRRGRIVEAMEMCERAAGMSLEARRMARFVEFECLMAWGRFAEAREVLDQGATARGLTVPASERRIQAVATMDRGMIAAEEGDFRKALSYLDEAREILQADEKVGITYHALRCWVEAASGLRAESESSARTATGLCAKVPDDRGAVIRYHIYLGRAALAAADLDAARQQFESCAALRPDPSGVPTVHYYLGECRLASGDQAGAAAEWRAAIATGLDTRYVHLAQKRLQELICRV